MKLEFVERETGEIIDHLRLEARLIGFFEKGIYIPITAGMDDSPVELSFAVEDAVEAAMEGVWQGMEKQATMPEIEVAVKKWAVQRQIETGEGRFLTFAQAILAILTHIDVNYKVIKEM